ncbi:MAG: TaqI-like C-terminal specificity domain-containing protein [Methanobacteriaceae archaeon]|nr:TaqI-like C-terminal specificity domain-containing protein [Methanobacteriaceae archaeon]
MLVNSLFNQPLMNKYLKKYQKEFKLTHSRKEALFKWIEKLENDELKDEVSNYGNFSRLILEQILGYDYQENIIENVKEDYGRGLSEFAIKKDNKKFMVIELKGSNADLDKPQNRKNDKRTPVDQAFDYAKRSGDINWIVVSNYKEFRLYNWHKKQHQYISFKAEDLKDPEIFKQFMLVFSSFSTIENNLIDKLVSKTIFVERDLEDEFYKLYNETRLMLIAEIENLHSEFTREQSVHYSQLILNRYIFICFAEDLGLLPEEISVESIENPVKNNNLGRNEIWHRLNSLFIDINEGNDFKKIYGYNGGLFSEDIEFLKIRDIVDDHSIFSDAYQKWKFEEYSLLVEEKLSPYSGKINPIYKNLMTISTFNFSSEVDVNILGHIFENSIGDIEELKADTKGRRKKDGIFYTPEYITDYICRNTIIPYLSKSGNVNTIQKLISEYSGSEIEELDKKVKNIKIVDPACGSGAFLNKAGDVLLEIHEAIRESKYEDDNTLMPFFDSIEERREILLNNIYGVDLNEESVEITKLSLFLKVCKEGLKLPNLDNNIKCGNSLINDPEYTDKPFNWEEEFNEIFEDGGFDVVIGNPPWGADLDKKSKKFINDFYNAIEYQIDTYVVFMEKGNNLLKNNGLLGFITPSTWLAMHFFKKIRSYLINETTFKEVILFKYQVFDDVTAETSILIYKKKPFDNNHIIKIRDISNYKEFINNGFREVYQSFWHKNLELGFNIIFDQKKLDLVEKIFSNSIKIREIANLTVGIKPYQSNKGIPKQSKEDVKNRIYDSDKKEDGTYKQYIVGKNIKKFSLNPVKTQWLKYGEWLAEPRKSLDFSQEKIVIRQTSDHIIATIDDKGYLNLNNVHNLVIKKEFDLNYNYILTVLNSKLIDFIYRYLVPEKGRVFAEVKGVKLKQLPIYYATIDEQKPLLNKSAKILELNKALNEELNGFKDWFKHTFKVEKLSQKLETYYNLTFDDFLIEAKKKKVDTNPRKTQELLKKEFEESLIKINPLLQKIEETDNEIDKMVYELYGLNEDEINIIENSLID